MKHLLCLAALCATQALLTACGGSDSSPAVVAPAASMQITGTAAAGAPIIGKVTVKDSAGWQNTVDIAANGSYAVDVSGRTAPFLFRAVGTVGGREVALSSMATTADVGKTINITPFTDLMVANIAGMASAQFFDSPVFSKLTAAEIDLARNQLTARLQPILTAMGVDAGFDLLRSAFTADHTKFDAVMDVVSVTVDSTSNTAMIQDLVNNTRIEDDLASKTDATALPPPVLPLAAAATDLDGITQVLKTITSLFASNVPDAANATLVNALSSDFLHHGLTRAQYLSSDHFLAAQNLGLQLVSVEILRRDAAGNVWAVLTQKDAVGHFSNAQVLFQKGSDGAWRLAGNRLHHEVYLTPINFSTPNPNGGIQYSRNLEIWVAGSMDNNVQYLTMTGPGLSSAVGVMRNSNGPFNFHIDGTTGYSNNDTYLRDCNDDNGSSPCVNYAQVPSDAVYTLTYYDHKGGTALPDTDTVLLRRPPVPNAVATAMRTAWFVTEKPALFTPATYQTLSDGAGITLAWGNPTDPAYKVTNVVMYSSTMYLAQFPGAQKTSVLLGNWSGAAPSTPPRYTIYSFGPFDRAFVVAADYPGN